MANKEGEFAAPVWGSAEYSCVSPGIYTATATRLQGPQWCFSFRRYSMLVEFELVGEGLDVRVCLFLNLGSDPQKAPGRQSKFYKAWTIANGGMPMRGEPMNFDVFLQGQLYEVEVGSISRDSELREKTEAEKYSTVKRIVKAKRANSNQESRIC